jgi:hypothetical protein
MLVGIMAVAVVHRDRVCGEALPEALIVGQRGFDTKELGDEGALIPMLYATQRTNPSS